MSDHPVPDPPTPQPNDEAAPVRWEDALVEGRFQLAHQAYTISDEHDGSLREALGTLADIEGYVRDKSWTRALNKLKRLEDPPAIVDWEGIAADLQSLWESSKSLDRRESAQALEQLLVRSTDFFEAEIATQRGTALIFDQELEAAQDAFHRALEFDPRHYRAITNLGNIALEQGRVDEAVEAYEKALKLNDDFPNAYHNLGVAYRRQGKFSKSVTMLRRAQRATNRRDAEAARSQLSRGGQRRNRNIRWIVIGAAVVVGYLLLRSRGII